MLHAIMRLHLATDPNAQAAAKPDGLHQALSALHKQMPALLAAKPPATAVEPLMQSILAAALVHKGRQGWDSAAGEASSMWTSHAGCCTRGATALVVKASYAQHSSWSCGPYMMTGHGQVEQNLYLHAGQGAAFLLQHQSQAAQISAAGPQLSRGNPVHTGTVQGAAPCTHLVCVEVPAEMLRQETGEAVAGCPGAKAAGALQSGQKVVLYCAGSQRRFAKPYVKQKAC